MPRFLLDSLILLAAAVLGVVLVAWADAEFVRVQPPGGDLAADATRPDWLMAWRYPSDRAQHDTPWALLAATLGVGGVIARRGGYRFGRGVRQPGALVVLVVLLLGGLTIAQGLPAMPAHALSNGLCFALTDRLDVRLPGAALGAWVVAWPARRRPADPAERLARLVGMLWVLDAGALAALGLVFG